ncbi:hypothetical protein LXM25_11120 [Dyadobacter sp. LJ53]|uniref:hypothetical protein n=1 Tax=Dyadobacter chenwenxiniae TaxID=2906456 RepID=UPI001F42529E|nr:hypothetical protein [Dyadobacter chenwenxiniae]MCF0050614.1 hypothetical protein [Dyadobacter chenwenxiniae]
MTKQAIIQCTIEAINQLPEEKAEEIFEFADFVRKRYEEHQLTNEIQSLIAGGSSLEFLDKEEELYSVADLKEIYNG